MFVADSRLTDAIIVKPHTTTDLKVRGYLISRLTDAMC